MYSYLAIGDSLTTGVGSTNGGFVLPYRSMAAERLEQPIYIHQLARSGLTCEQIVRLASKHRKQIYHADIITITAGGNNFIDALKYMQRTGSMAHLPHTASTVYQCLYTLIHLIDETKKTSTKPYIIRIFNLYNPLLESPELNQLLTTFNRSLYTLEQNRHVRIVDVSSIFDRRNNRNISRDGVHPNNRGYEQMAVAAYRTGFYPL